MSYMEPRMILPVTRENIDELLDKGLLQLHRTNGTWWTIRRNGRTQLWKAQPERIRIPFKYGMLGYGAITTWDFLHDGTLDTGMFRVKP